MQRQHRLQTQPNASLIQKMLRNGYVWSAEHLYRMLAGGEHLPFLPTMQLLMRRTQHAAQFPPLTDCVSNLNSVSWETNNPVTDDSPERGSQSELAQQCQRWVCSQKCTFAFKQVTITAFTAMMKAESQEPSSFCCGCFPTKPWILEKDENRARCLCSKARQNRLWASGTWPQYQAEGWQPYCLTSGWQRPHRGQREKVPTRKKPQRHVKTPPSSTTRWPHTPTYFLWNLTTGSSRRSVKSSFLPFSMTSLCLRTNSQPMWEKKKPRRALWGSASVSEYLWCTRWSRLHS